MVTQTRRTTNARRTGPVTSVPSLLIALLLAAGVASGGATVPTNASLVQDDGESGGDAPDACISNDPSDLTLVSSGTYGQLVAVEDPADVYTLKVENGQTVDVIQDLASSKETSINLNLPHTPHAPHLPHVDEAVPHDTENPFALQVLDITCTVVATSDDPSVLPRTISISTEGTYQVRVYESGGTGLGSTRDAADGMCHPPCQLDGYLVEAPVV